MEILGYFIFFLFFEKSKDCVFVGLKYVFYNKIIVCYLVILVI